MKKRLISIIMTTALAVMSVVPVMADEVNADNADEIIVESVDEADEEFVLDDLIDISYDDETASEESIEEIVEIDEEVLSEDVVSDGETAFSADVTVDGYTLVMQADAGVFPNGTTVDVVKASEEKEAQIAREVSDKINDAKIAKTITFDFTFTDTEGNVVEPQGGAVNVSVRTPLELNEELAGMDDAYVNVYHVDDALAFEEVATFSADALASEGIAFDADEFSSYTLVIYQPNKPDSKPPVLKNIKLNKTSFNIGEVLEVTLKVTDDLSGFNMAFITFVNTKNSDYVSVPIYSYDNKKGEQTIRSGLAAGTYMIYSVELYDNVMNRVTYGNRADSSKKLPTSLRNLSFKVKAPKEAFSPSVSSVVSSPKSVTVKVNEYQEVTINAKASSKSGEIDRIYLTLKNKSDSVERTVCLNSTSTKNKFSGPLVVDSRSKGKLYISGINCVSKKGTIKSIKLSSTLKNKAVLTVSVKGVKKVTYAGAKVSKITFKKRTMTIPKGEGMYNNPAKISADITNVKSGEFVSMYVTLVDTKDSTNSMSIQLRNYSDQMAVDEDGNELGYYVPKLNPDYKTKCYGTFALAENARCCNMKISNVSVNTWKSSNTKQRLYSVSDPYTGKNTLTSDMKKVKLTVKKK